MASKSELTKVVVFAASQCADPFLIKFAFDLGRALALRGFECVNGGGPGLMDSFLEGAKSVGGKTYAIQLNKHAREQSRYADEAESFDRLKPRQARMIELGDAFVALPGGLGTVYEIMEIFASKNAGEIIDKPLILFSDFYRDLIKFLEGQVEKGMVRKKWEDYFSMAKDIESCVNILESRFPNCKKCR